MRLPRLRTLLAAALASLALAAPSAVAGWYYADGAGAFGTLANGNYTNGGAAGYWTFGLFDNENTGASKQFFRVRYSAGCGGTLTTVQWNSTNYGNPKNWTIPFSTGGCSYTYGRNVSGGNARLAAGQFQ